MVSFRKGFDFGFQPHNQLQQLGLRVTRDIPGRLDRGLDYRDSISTMEL